MPKKTLPSYRLHSPTGQAIVVLRGKMFYLGKYKSKTSRARCNELIAEYLANDCKLPPTRTKTELTIEDAIIQFLDYAEGYYSKNGRPTSSVSNHREGLAFLTQYYGQSAVAEFGPVALQFLREKMIEAGNSQNTVNIRSGCIVNLYRWLVINEKCPVEIFQALRAVPRLTRGRSKAAPPKIVKPVPQELVEQTLPYLSPVVADMIRVQLFTGCRPSEICNMRPCDIEQSGDVWKFVPMEYKTDYLDGIRPPTPIGPRAQAILTPYLEKLASTPESFVFSPHDAVILQRIEKRKNRKSFNKKGEVQPSQRNRFKLTPRWTPRDHYSADSYRQAIERGTQKAGLPHWTPHQLRHSAGTEIREKWGLDAAQAVLGHSNAKTTEIYAEISFEKAAQVARERG